MKRLGLGLILAVAATTSSNAATTIEHRLQRDFYLSGQACKPLNNSASAQYSEFGIRNPGTTPIDVGCQLVTTETRLPPPPSGGTSVLLREDIFSPQVILYDRDPNSNFSCTLLNLDTTGNLVWTSQQKFSNLSGASVQVLTFSVPSPGVIFDDTWTLRCSIPPATSSGISYLTSMYMRVEQP